MELQPHAFGFEQRTPRLDMLGVNISGAATCTLQLPEFVARVPAGTLGFVMLKVAPSLTLEVTGQIDLRASVTLTCGVQYKWDHGDTSNPAYCHATNEPLQVTAATGIDATLTGAIDASVTLNDIIGVTGSISAAAHAGYHPTASPVVQIDASVTVELGGCIVCFIDDGLVKFTMYEGTLFEKVLYTSDTPPDPTPPPPLAITTTTLPDAVLAQPYTATLSATGGAAPYTWAVASGSPPPGLSLSASGSITGTPTTLGSASFTMTARDAAGATSQASLTLAVIPDSGTIRARTVSTGETHSCALTVAGGVKCWGDNSYGQLGDGSKTASSIPVDVYGLGTGVVAISAGGYGSCVVTSAGAAKCWGDNSYGELGDGSKTASSIPVDVFGLGTGVKAISAGGWVHTCAVTSAGAAKCWGWNPHGELGDATYTDSAVPVDVVGLDSGVVAVSAGYGHSCAVTAAGAAKCWGAGSAGRLGDGTGTSSAVPVDVVGLGSEAVGISASFYDTCAVTSAGDAKCWGDNSWFQLGDGTQNNSAVPVGVVGLGSGVVAVSSRQYHSCALTSAGAVKCWGYNASGELGDGTTIHSSVASAVVGLGAGVVGISTGGWHACAVTSAGTVKCWGGNSAGQLGDGTTTGSLVPVGVVGLG